MTRSALIAALLLAACPPGSGLTDAGVCGGLATECAADLPCCSGFFCDHGRCAFGTAPLTSGGAGGSSGGDVQGTTCNAPNVLCDGACIPADECGVNAGGSGGPSGGGSSGGVASAGGTSTGGLGASGGSSGGIGGCPVDGGAAGAGCTVFTAPLTFSTPAPVRALALGDVNGDGVLDLVAATGGGILVYLGGGCGGFSGPIVVGAAADWDALALGSLAPDGGGPPDIAALESGASEVGIYLDKGLALFGDAGVFPAAGDEPVALALADVDRDGKADLVVADQGDGTVAVLLGNGDGTFQPPESWPACAPAGVAGCAASGLAQLAVADLTGDGWPDVATANAGANAVAVLLHADGGFGPAASYATQGVAPRWIATADLAGTGHPDLVVATEGSGTAVPTLEVFRPADAGRFGAISSSFVIPGPGGQVAAASFRAGVLPDVLIAEPASGAAQLFLNDNSGNLSASETCPTVPNASVLAVGDVNGDGKPDAVLGAGEGDGGTIAVLLNVSF